MFIKIQLVSIQDVTKLTHLTILAKIWIFCVTVTIEWNEMQHKLFDFFTYIKNNVKV